MIDLLFPFLSMLASNLDKSTEKRLQNNTGREKAGIRAMWPKLSVKDCSLLDSRSLCRHVTPLPTGEEERCETTQGMAVEEQTTHNLVALEDKECDVTLPNSPVSN